MVLDSSFEPSAKVKGSYGTFNDVIASVCATAALTDNRKHATTPNYSRYKRDPHP